MAFQLDAAGSSTFPAPEPSALFLAAPAIFVGFYLGWRMKTKRLRRNSQRRSEIYNRLGQTL